MDCRANPARNSYKSSRSALEVQVTHYYMSCVMLRVLVLILFAAAHGKVATIHDLGGNYDCVFRSKSSSCWEHVRMIVDYPNLVQVELKNYSVKCNLPLEFTMNELNATHPWSDEYRTMVEPHEAVLLSGHTNEYTKPLTCSGLSMAVKLFYAQQNLTKFGGITLAKGSKYLLLKEVPNQDPIGDLCLYSSTTSTKPSIPIISPNQEPSNWTKIGVIAGTISSFCTLFTCIWCVSKYVCKRDDPHSCDTEEELSETEDDSHCCI